MEPRPTRSGPVTVEDVTQALRDVEENFRERARVLDHATSTSDYGRDYSVAFARIYHSLSDALSEVADHIEGVHE